MVRRQNPSGIAQKRIVRVLRIGGEVDVDELIATQADRIARVRNTILGEILLVVASIAALATWGDSNVVQSLVALLLIPLMILATSQAASWCISR